MYLQASQIIGRFVLIEDADEHAGAIDRIIIDPADGLVRALGVRPPGLFTKEAYLATTDIMTVVREGVVIRDAEQVTDLDELIRVQEILKQKTPIIGQPAKTVGGQQLGRVDDLLVDLDLWMVTKYYLRALLDERILPADQVHSITKQAVIFLDQPTEGQRVKAEPAAA